MNYTILGGGLAGLSVSYHIGHNKCHILEKNNFPFGHIHSEKIKDFTWDQGPHISFTTNDYVKNLFSQSVKNEFQEYDVNTTNYFYGSWIPHPAQSNLFAVPEPLKTECLLDFLKSRNNHINIEPKNYDEWLRIAFGNKFTNEFPYRYTKKYWTIEPKKLATNWIGKRVYYPSIEDVKKGYYTSLEKQTHYIQKVRYPKQGGYESFAKILEKEANIFLNKNIEKIYLKERKIFFTDGTNENYEKLISTIPLTEFVTKSDLPEEIKRAAENLSYSSVLLINIIANHPTIRSENWIYVYDENKYSTRINCTELLSPYNGVEGKSGIQVEVYFSKYKKKSETDEKIKEKVIDELIEMGLIADKKLVEFSFTKLVPYANVIFDTNYKENLNSILNALEEYGLIREEDDLEPLTNWDKKLIGYQSLGNLILAGRYAQWKYYWTDDCVLRGKFIKENQNGIYK